MHVCVRYTCIDVHVYTCVCAVVQCSAGGRLRIRSSRVLRYLKVPRVSVFARAVPPDDFDLLFQIGTLRMVVLVVTERSGECVVQQRTGFCFE